jgi:hypothetical protein
VKVNGNDYNDNEVNNQSTIIKFDGGVIPAAATTASVIIVRTGTAATIKRRNCHWQAPH